jgi:hypothetical protein
MTDRLTLRDLADALVPWAVSLIALAVGIYFVFCAAAIQRELIPKAKDRSLTASGERYVKSRAYRVVTRIVGIVSMIVGVGGIYLLARKLF